VTRDLLVTEFMYLQFYIAMGCFYTAGRCYGLLLEQFGKRRNRCGKFTHIPVPHF